MTRTIVLFTLLTGSIMASTPLSYESKLTGSLGKIFSVCNSQISKNLTMNIDLGSALSMIDPTLLESALQPSAKVVNPEKTVLTFSYRF